MQASSSGLRFSLHYSSYPLLVSECIGKVRLHPLPNPEYLQRIFHHYFEFFVELCTSEMAPGRAAIASRIQSPLQTTIVSPRRHTPTCFSRYSTKYHSSNMPSLQFVSSWVCALSMVSPLLLHTVIFHPGLPGWLQHSRSRQLMLLLHELFLFLSHQHTSFMSKVLKLGRRNLVPACIS